MRETSFSLSKEEAFCLMLRSKSIEETSKCVLIFPTLALIYVTKTCAWCKKYRSTICTPSHSFCKKSTTESTWLISFSWNAVLAISARMQNYWSTLSLDTKTKHSFSTIKVHFIHFLKKPCIWNLSQDMGC